MLDFIKTNESADGYLSKSVDQWTDVINIARDAEGAALRATKIKEDTVLALERLALSMSETSATVVRENIGTEVSRLREMINDGINNIAAKANFGHDNAKAAPLLENTRKLSIDAWIPGHVLVNKDTATGEKAFVGIVLSLSKRPEKTSKRISDAVIKDYNDEMKKHPTITQAVVEALTGHVGLLFSDHLQMRTKMEERWCTHHNIMEMKANGILYIIANCMGRQHPSHEDKELARRIQKAYEAENGPSRLALDEGVYFQSFNELDKRNVHQLRSLSKDFTVAVGRCSTGPDGAKKEDPGACDAQAAIVVKGEFTQVEDYAMSSGKGARYVVMGFAPGDLGLMSAHIPVFYKGKGKDIPENAAGVIKDAVSDLRRQAPHVRKIWLAGDLNAHPFDVAHALEANEEFAATHIECHYEQNGSMIGGPNKVLTSVDAFFSFTFEQ